jgi:hypothetical protein
MYAQSSLLLCNTGQSRRRVNLQLVSSFDAAQPERFYLARLERSREGLTTSKFEHLDGKCY